MRVAIDYDSVVSTHPTAYAKIVDLLLKSGNSVVLTSSSHNAVDADEWAYHAGVREVFVVGPTKQHQDILSADVWCTGRPDRVLGREQVCTIYHKYRSKGNPDDYH